MKTRRPVFNPFYDTVKADDIPIEQTKNFFVREASPIWQEVQQPVNQIIRGPRGVGKTILLKQLSFLGGDHTHSYVGVYVQISRIANTFRHLFPLPERADRSTLELSYQTAFGDYLVLEIIKEIAKTVTALTGDYPSTALATDFFRELLDGAEDATSSREVAQFCIVKQRQIETDSKLWEIQQKCSWKPLFDPVATLNRIAVITAGAFQGYPLGGKNILYFLLDESAPISIRCQQVVNSLLQRGRTFRTKLAVRPYEWTSLDTYHGLRLEPETDFRRLELLYPDEMTEDYIDKARKILNRLLTVRVLEPSVPPSGWPHLSSLDIETIFPVTGGRLQRTYSGIRDICALSSSNPQHLISICSELFKKACEEGEWEDSDIPAVPRLLQHQAMVTWAKEQEETITDTGLQLLIQALLRLLAKEAEAGAGISLRIVQDNPTLFPSDQLPSDVAALVKPGFSLGLFRVDGPALLPWDNVPNRFTISRSLLLSHDVPLRVERKPEVAIADSFIRSHSREYSGSHVAPTLGLGERRLTAFLSTSFSHYRAAERSAIREALRQVDIECNDLGNKQFVYSAIRGEISRRDVTILNTSELRPYTLLELGLCAGLAKAKPVVCVFNDDDNEDAFKRLPEFLKVLTIITFSCEPNRLDDMALRVRQSAEHLIESPSEFERVHGEISLRPKRSKDTLFLSYPDLPIWKLMLPHLRDKLEEKGVRLITEQDANVYQANCLQIPIFCTSLAGLTVVDTSGSDHPDLLQCYKLGLSLAGKRAVLRIEQAGRSHRETFSAVPLVYAEWKDEKDLLTSILEFIEKERTHKHAKNK